MARLAVSLLTLTAALAARTAHASDSLDPELAPLDLPHEPPPALGDEHVPPTAGTERAPLTLPDEPRAELAPLGLPDEPRARTGAGLAPPGRDAPPAPARAAERAWLDLRVGFEGGGAPLLRPPGGPVAATTARTSASVFARISSPVLSSRVVELAWIPHHGASVVLQSADLRLGPLALHFLDLGLFYTTDLPVTVARVTRTWDLVVGAGAELSVTSRLDLVVDARLFTPFDLWDVVTRYGDTARLIGDELVHGVQLWGGAALRW